MGDLLSVEGVSKAFGNVVALHEVSLAVEERRIAALLGPNGAGKTTLVRIIATLLRPDAGRAALAGFDVGADPYAVRARVGLTGQYAGLDEVLTGRDNLVLVGRLAGLGRRTARSRAGELIGRFGLSSTAERSVSTYSGGERRRLDLAASLMSRPLLLVLDEPTTGLDPAARLQLWDVVAALRAEGTTVLLTTQYLEEADRLADHVYVLDHGKLAASGTPAELKTRTGRQRVVARLASAQDAASARRALTGRLELSAGELRVSDDPPVITIAARDGTDFLCEVAAALRAEAIPVLELGLRQPSLDEVFLALTGASQRTDSLQGTGAA